MSSAANVVIHSSQYPANVGRDLLESLRTGRVNHKFHYDSVKQTQKWLALHEVHSPAHNDRDCVLIYDRSFGTAAARIKSNHVHVIGLGCGGGQKDTGLLKLLRKAGKQISYTPSDVSVAMTLVARQAALTVVPERNCFPLVCDLTTTDDLRPVLKSYSPAGVARIITFFGMIPNFEPKVMLPKLAALVRQGDWLLFSANLAPGSNYIGGMERVLPQYDNALTRDWLMTFLLDLGVEHDDGKLCFSIEDGEFSLKRIIAKFRFLRRCKIQVGDEIFDFIAGSTIRLFFSYRYTPVLARKVLGKFGIVVVDEWITRSEEEGVFLCHKK